MPAESNEETLQIARIAAGDREAFEKLYFSYQKRLFGYLYRMLGQAGPAEELLNDVMVEVWKSAGRFRGDSRPSTWIFGIAHHRLLNHLRQRRWEAVDLDAIETRPDPGEQPEQGAVRMELEGAIHSALGQLSAQHREVVELTFYQGCSYDEIARIARCPANTVKTRMFHAKKKLQEILSKMGIGRQDQ